MTPERAISKGELIESEISPGTFHEQFDSNTEYMRIFMVIGTEWRQCRTIWLSHWLHCARLLWTGSSRTRNAAHQFNTDTHGTGWLTRGERERERELKKKILTCNDTKAPSVLNRADQSSYWLDVNAHSANHTYSGSGIGQYIGPHSKSVSKTLSKCCLLQQITVPSLRASVF